MLGKAVNVRLSINCIDSKLTSKRYNLTFRTECAQITSNRQIAPKVQTSLPEKASYFLTTKTRSQID